MNLDNTLPTAINNDSKSEYYKKWYAENKESKLAYQKEKIKCEICEVMVTRTNMGYHKKSILHKKNLELLQKDLALNNIIINTESNSETNDEPNKMEILLTKLCELDDKIKEIKEIKDCITNCIEL